MYALFILPPWLSLFLISFIISLAVTIIYKYVTNQAVLKSIKEELKDLQKLSREAQKAGDTKKMNEINKKLLQKNALYMKHSMRSTLITIIPLFLVYAWLGAHYTYQPLVPNQVFNVTISFSNYTGKVTALQPLNSSIKLVGINKREVVNGSTYFTYIANKGGKYKMNYQLDDLSDPTLKEISARVLISKASEYEKPKQEVKSNPYVNTIILSNKPLKINLGIKMGWFWAYFIFSMIATSISRKILNVY